jgi:hypothetical protein
VGQVFLEIVKNPDQDPQLKQDQDRKLSSAAEEYTKKTLAALPYEPHDITFL